TMVQLVPSKCSTSGISPPVRRAISPTAQTSDGDMAATLRSELGPPGPFGLGWMDHLPQIPGADRWACAGAAEVGPCCAPMVATSEPPVLSPAARERMLAAREVVDRKVAAGETVYGVTTGLGSLANVRLEPDEVRRLQHDLLRSHAVGVGPPLDEREVRAMLLLRAHVLALGFSGVRPVVVERLLDFLNRELLPVVP